MVSALDRFRASERAPLISQKENARNVQNRFMTDLKKATINIKPIKPLTPLTSNRITTTTDPVGEGTRSLGDPGRYPKTLPALSAAQLADFSNRRRRADKMFKEAVAKKGREEGRFKVEAARQKEKAKKSFTNTSEDIMQELGGKGLARMPRAAGRQQRRLGESLRDAFGEIDTELGTQLAALEEMVTEIRTGRDEELAQIGVDELLAKSDLKQLFPAGDMYGA